jgi:hypothetical protein
MEKYTKLLCLEIGEELRIVEEKYATLSSAARLLSPFITARATCVYRSRLGHMCVCVCVCVRVCCTKAHQVVESEAGEGGSYDI